MKSAEIYKILNSCLKDELKALNFKKLKYCQLGWYKSIGDNFITFEFQCNRWGWTYNTGTDFRFTFSCRDTITAWGWSIKPVVRLNELIEADDLHALVALQNTAINKFIPFDGDYKEAHPTAESAFLDYLQEVFEPISFPPSLFDMERMRIYDENDVLNWGEFFRKKIKRISNSLEIKWHEST